MQLALRKTAIGEEAGKRYDAAIAKIAEQEKVTPLAVAAKIDRDGFFQECQRQGEDPAKMVMAYYLKYVQEK